MKHSELKAFLNAKFEQYHHSSFSDDDPIQIPHRYSLREDVEISAFLTASIAWGQRITIIRNAAQLMKAMGSSPFDFVMEHREEHLKPFYSWRHRTFWSEDLTYFFRALRNLYREARSLELYFAVPGAANLYEGIHRFHDSILAYDPPERTP